MFCEDIRKIESTYEQKVVEIEPSISAPHFDAGTEILCTLTVIHLEDGRRIVWNSTLGREQ